MVACKPNSFVYVTGHMMLLVRVWEGEATTVKSVTFCVGAVFLLLSTVALLSW